MQHQSADHLHIEMTHARCAHASLADHCKRFRQNLVQRFLLAILAIVFVARVFDLIGDLRFEKCRALAQLLVGELLNLWLKGIDLLDDRTNRLQEPFITAAEN